MQYLGFIEKAQGKAQGLESIVFSEVTDSERQMSHLFLWYALVTVMQARAGILHFSNDPGAVCGVLLCNPYSEQSWGPPQNRK